MTDQTKNQQHEDYAFSGEPQMHEQDEQDPEIQELTTLEEPEEEPTEPVKKDPVRKWTLIILLITVGLLCWYLVADRLTPYSTQARLHALVVPITPLISGQVEEVMVGNNQAVARDDILFTIDTDNYDLQLQAAEADLQVARQTVGASTAGITAAEASVASAIASRTRAEQDAIRLRGIRRGPGGDFGATAPGRRGELGVSSRKSRLRQSKFGEGQAGPW